MLVMTEGVQPQTFEDAVERQREVHRQIDEGTWKEGRGESWRWHSLKAGYQVRRVPEYGTGYYPVNIETGEVCEWKGKWSDDGAVLLCTECFMDGT